MPGAKKCVYCGAAVPASESRAGSEFSWNVQDFPKPRKKTNVSIDWGGEKITDKDSGRTYFQKESRWEEPEEAKSMFNFDMTHENLQQKFDKKLDDLAADEPPASLRSRGNDDIFVLPSEMQMEDFSDLIDDIPTEKRNEPETAHMAETEPEQIRTENEIRNIERTEPRREAGNSDRDSHKGAESHTAAGRGTDSGNASSFSGSGSATRRKYENYDPFEGMGMGRTEAETIPDFLKGTRPMRMRDQSGIHTAPANEVKKESAKRSNGNRAEMTQKSTGEPERGYTEEEERRAVKGFQNLLNAEKTFSDKMGKAAHMSDAELEKVHEADRRREYLTEAPEISFRTLEDEYERYRSSREKETAEKAKSVGSRNGGAAGSRTRKKAEKENPREVNIKINEPSGTKFSVKTQEIDLAKIQDDNVKTQPVDLNQIKQGPKSVQVQVEVSSSQSSSSVEVTRRHDGATVVKTLENGTEKERLYDEPDDAENAVPGEELTGKSFWEKSSSPAGRMTITDIFGPEAKDFRDKWEEEENDDNQDDSMILGISPEDIALTRDQTQAIETVTPPDDFSDTLDLGKRTLSIDDALRNDLDADASVMLEDTGADDISGSMPDNSVNGKNISVDEEKGEEASAAESVKIESVAAEPVPAEKYEKDAGNPEDEAEIKLSDMAAVLDKVLEDDSTEAGNDAEISAVNSDKSGADAEARSSEDVENAAFEKTDDIIASEEEKVSSINDINDDTGTAYNFESIEDHELSGAGNEESKSEENEADGEEISQAAKRYDDITTMIPVDEINEKAAEQERDAEEGVSVRSSAGAAARHEETASSEKNDGRGSVAFSYTVKEDSSEKEVPEETENVGDKILTEESRKPRSHKLAERLRNRRSEKERIKSEKQAAKEAEPQKEETKDIVLEKSVTKAEPEKKSLTSRIMQIVIIILIIAIAIEFLIIGIKLFAPDSQGALLISRIENSFSGESFGSYKALEQSQGIQLDIAEVSETASDAA